MNNTNSFSGGASAPPPGRAASATSPVPTNIASDLFPSHPLSRVRDSGSFNLPRPSLLWKKRPLEPSQLRLTLIFLEEDFKQSRGRMEGA